MKTLYVVVGSSGEDTTAHTWLVSAHAKRAEAERKCELFSAIAGAAAEWYRDLPYPTSEEYEQEIRDVTAALNDVFGYREGYDDTPHFSVETVTMPKHTPLVASHPAWATIIAAMPLLTETFIEVLGKEAV